MSGDFIVGFPGETDEDFEATLRIVDEVRYASAYSFKYSARPGTPAATMEDQIPREIMDERLQRLQSLLTRQLDDFNRQMVGRTLPVLFEKPGRYAGQLIGKSPYLQPVHATADEGLIGQVVDVDIDGLSHFSLAGKLPGHSQAHSHSLATHAMTEARA